MSSSASQSPSQSASAGFKRNLTLLFLLQAFGSTTSVAMVTAGSVAARGLATETSLATLPITAFVVGSALVTFFASLIMGRYGRSAGFRLGVGFGIAGSALCALALELSSFWLLCFGAAVIGGYAAFVAYARFAAAEAAPDDYQSRAIAWVMTAGIVGAVLGPESTKWTQGLLAERFAGTYAALSAMNLLALLCTLPLRLPAPGSISRPPNPRELWRVLSRREGHAAIASSVVGYAVMVFLMTATPLAMTHHDHAYDDAAFVIQWHVLGMYAPSFVTGSLVRRTGAIRVILAGCGLIAACVGLNWLGTSLAHFWLALLLLGVGWNFTFIGGTSLLATAFEGEERFLAQGANETLVFAVNAVSSGASGVLLARHGWQLTNLIALPFLILPLALALAHRGRTAPPRAVPEPEG